MGSERSPSGVLTHVVCSFLLGGLTADVCFAIALFFILHQRSLSNLFALDCTMSTILFCRALFFCSSTMVSSLLATQTCYLESMGPLLLFRDRIAFHLSSIVDEQPFCSRLLYEQQNLYRTFLYFCSSTMVSSLPTAQIFYLDSLRLLFLFRKASLWLLTAGAIIKCAPSILQVVLLLSFFVFFFFAIAMPVA